MKIERKVVETLENLNLMTDGAFEAGLAVELYKAWNKMTINGLAEGNTEQIVMQAAFNEVARLSLETIRAAQKKGLIR